MADIDWDGVIARLNTGWTKTKGFGRYWEPKGAVCLVGAVCWVLGETDAWNGENRVLESPLPRIVEEQFPGRIQNGHNRLSVEAFNDHPDTTLDDVIAVCEKARAES